MKIKKLFISKYKNIPEKEITFNTDLTTLIIGQNGLGKSNLLEAITLIFVALSNNDDYLNLSNFDGRYFSFKISYILREKSISITCGLDNKYQIQIDNSTLAFKKDGIYDHKIIRKYTEILVPDYFVTYYSGQNRRLENILKKFEDDYFQGLRTNKENSDLTTRRKFLYLKNYHAPILILVLSIFKDFEKDGIKVYETKVNNLLKHLDIQSIDSFSMTLQSPDWIAKKYKNTLSEEDKMTFGFVDFIHTTLSDKKRFPFPFWELKSSLNKLLQCLTDAVDINIYNNEEEKKTKENFSEFIEYNNVNIKDLQQTIYENFLSPLELFYSIEALVLLNILDLEYNLKFEIKKSNNLSLSYNLLSEGENQLFLVLGMILITGVDETLFLLDEPDTYLNPKWQREYIQLLEDFNLEDDDSHLIVTTHSPLLVQNIEGDNRYNYDLILLSKNNKGEVEFDEDKALFKNWRIDQVLSSKYFDLTSTRPILLDDYIKEKESIIYNTELTLEEKEKQIDLLITHYGNLPTGESRNEIQSMLLINEIIKKFGK